MDLNNLNAFVHMKMYGYMENEKILIKTYGWSYATKLHLLLAHW